MRVASRLWFGALSSLRVLSLSGCTLAIKVTRTGCDVELLCYAVEIDGEDQLGGRLDLGIQVLREQGVEQRVQV